MRSALIAIACCGTLWACDLPTAPDFPETSVTAFEPPPQYAYWWSLVEGCASRTGAFSEIRWYRTNGQPLVVDGEEYDGYWWASGNRIVVTNINMGRTVRHEMLHALLKRGDHPLGVFAGACDGVVSFDTPETYGMSPVQAAKAKTVRADSALVVSIAADPAVPRASEHAGWFTFVVTAVNRTANPVWIALPSDYTGLYVYLEGGLVGTAMPTKATRVFFAPGQRRRVVLDGLVDTAGVFHVSGGYAGAHSPWMPVTFEP